MNLAADLNPRATLVLTVFCGLLCLQTACAAGLLPHCGHPDPTVHNTEPCAQDHCRDDFSLPLQFDPHPQVDTGKAMTITGVRLLPTVAVAVAHHETPQAAPFPVPPSGHFPLLI